MDLAEKIAALQRKKAAAEVGLRTRGVVNVAASSGRADNAAAAAGGSDPNSADRVLRRPQETSPRRSSASSQHQQLRTKHLFNPDIDPIPVVRARPPQEPVSPQSQHAQPQQPQRQLFDPRRDDPMRFAVLNNQAQQRHTSSSVQSSSVMDHSSISSYASSTWTLTSSTGTSQSSAPPEQPQDRDGTNKFVAMLKKVYREITEFEKKIKEWDNADEQDNVLTQVTMLRPGASVEEAPEPQDPLRSLVAQHRQLAELYHSMITMILQPVPPSMLSFVTKYQLPNRLWTNGVAHCIDCLRRMGVKYPGAGEYMTSYIYWAYHFYEALYETSSLNEFMAPYKVNWIEALGDLARWHMHIISRQSSHEPVGSASVPLTEQALPASAPRAGDTPPPSIGLAAAQAFDLEPEAEIWRRSSQTWYAMVLKETPGAGKLHHNLGLLNTDAPNEELRGVYHFVKSMTANHPYATSREAILTLFSKPAQQRRNLAADAKSPELFVLLHGMLFTNIQLDDFQPTLVRYLERLQLDGAQEREWIMMAVVNIAAILQYGKADAMIKPPTGTGTGNEPAPTTIAGKKRELVLKMDSLAMTDSPIATRSSEMDIDSNSMAVDIPHSLQLALQLAFSTLSFCLQHPFRRSSPFAKPTLNPYITVLLTFLQTILKQPGVLTIIERSFPWDDLIAFLRTVPRRQLQKEVEIRAKLTSGCAPLPEDWCLRGMVWAGRRVYEHGFWPRGATAGGGVTGEMDVLLADENMEQDTDGFIEDEGDGRGEDTVPKDYTGRRWVRIIRSGLSFVQSVTGFDLYHGEDGISWRLGEAMERKAEMWKEEERREREEEERRRNRHWSDDEDEEMLIDEEEEEEELDDDPEVRALQERRRYLKTLQNGHSPYRRSSHARHRQPKVPARPLLDVRPGYTVLVLDTNILLSALPAVITLIESEKWTILIPLAVITELDGISSNNTELGKAASDASQYITNHIRSHSTSLKVQTSRGNYLTTLNVRSEQFDFFSRRRGGSENGAHSWERSLDDLILRAAVWQEAHWIDRSGLLKGLSPGRNANVPHDVVKVVLLTFDRNLRLKARSRHMHAGDERDLANILRIGSSS
ncbi:hypothetical protein FRC17_009869 [Serendipita sp. 399]|nr:hypothetical protein FRC17_009869 [Serendipita sp. 399]